MDWRNNLISRTLELDRQWVLTEIARFHAEDLPNGDVTTEFFVAAQANAVFRIETVQPLVFAGAQVIPHCFHEPVELELLARDGDFLEAGDLIGYLRGPARIILTGERVMLNLIQRLSGIATVTHRFVELAAPLLVLDTRKTTPGLRRFEKYGVAVGGGWNHRMNLSVAGLLKDNHLRSIKLFEDSVRRFRMERPSLFLELEVEDLEWLERGLAAGVDGFLLDNMKPDRVVEFVGRIRSEPGGEKLFIEASGGMTMETVSSYRLTGIDAVSVGALTHSAVSCDIRLELE